MSTGTPRQSTRITSERHTCPPLFLEKKRRLLVSSPRRGNGTPTPKNTHKMLVPVALGTVFAAMIVGFPSGARYLSIPYPLHARRSNTPKVDGREKKINKMVPKKRERPLLASLLSASPFDSLQLQFVFDNVTIARDLTLRTATAAVDITRPNAPFSPFSPSP